MFGISAPEFIVLLAVAAVVLGPERMPQYAQQLGRLIRELRRMAQGASQQVRSEMGPEFDDIDWRKLDPRQYDPRRIVRDALTDTWDDEEPAAARRPAAGSSPAAGPGVSLGKDVAPGAARREAPQDAPFDEDAT